MARQKLINLHSSGTTVTSLYTGDNALVLGEIAVQHAQSAPKLHIRVSNGEGAMVAETLASFVDESAVDLKISTAVGTVSQNVDAINAKIGGDFDATNTVAKAIADEASARASADSGLSDSIETVSSDLSAEVTAREATDELLSNEITARTSADTELDNKIDRVGNDVDAIQLQLEGIPAGSGAVATYVAEQIAELTDALDEITAATPASDYVTVTVSDKSVDRKQTVGVSVDVVGVNEATALKQGLADAFDVKGITGGLATRIGNAENDIDALQLQLVGIGSESGAVKDYVDTSVSTAIASVYKVKGSVATYDALSGLTGMAEGDVYNVEAAATVDGKYYPAGTNWVWVAGTPSGHWDPLGGTIDLSPYLYVSAFTAYTAATETTIGNIQSDVRGLQTDLSAETTARENAISAIDAKIGGSYSSSSTVADAISREATARGNEDSRLNNLITTETQTRENEIDGITGTTSTLREDLDNEIARAKTAETANSNAISAINNKIGGSYSSSSTVADAISREATARGNGDDAINAKLGNGVTSANTVTAQLGVLSGSASTLASSAETNAQNITAINEKLGSGFTTASTVASQLAAVKTTADGAVQSISVKNTSTNMITATEDGTTHNVELDFDNMVIDCGTY